MMTWLKKNIWILNAVACVFGFIAGVTCFIDGSIIFGVIDMLLSAANGYFAVRGYRNR